MKKIASLKNLFNKPISEVQFILKNLKQIEEISDLIKNEGSTEIKISVKDQNKNILFKLKNKRYIDRKSLNIIKKHDISINID